MNAQEARAMTEAAHERQHNEEERRLKTALDVVYKQVAEAADKGVSKVEVKFNGTPKNKHPELFIGEWPILHWDGGERTDIDPKTAVLIKRLKDDGFKAEAHYNCLEVSW